jgi:hypothetical protein
MSIHKLTAGLGYDYLARQVVALDATEKGHVGLASYCTAHGETPGAWIGSGTASIDRLSAGDAVTAEQMGAPLAPACTPAAQRLEHPGAADLSGNPDMHTHVAVASNVQTLDRRWRSIDGRVLFKATWRRSGCCRWRP